MLGKAALAFWNGIQPGGDAEFLAWHVSEHIPERVGLPGFLRGRRYVANEVDVTRPRYFNFYETDTLDALESPVYRDRLDHPTPWTTKVVATFTDTSRTMCRVAHTQGMGEGAWMQTIRVSFPAERDVCIDALIALLTNLPTRTPLVGAHLLDGVQRETKPTRELELRGRPDAQIDGVLLIEAADEATLAALAREALSDEALMKTGVRALLRGTYRLEYSLIQHQRDMA
nr:DUF4286 family protein [Caballeronia sp. BR00000012568055]